jgi:stalled ribosome rescue protein Dom34
MWDSMALDTLKQASDPAASADLAVVLMQEGLAQIFLVGRSVTSSRARIETSIPRKHGPAIAGYESVCSFTVSSYMCPKFVYIFILSIYVIFCFSVGFEEIF